MATAFRATGLAGVVTAGCALAAIPTAAQRPSAGDLARYEMERAAESQRGIDDAEREISSAEIARLSGRCRSFRQALENIDRLTEPRGGGPDEAFYAPVIPYELSVQIRRRKETLAALPCPPPGVSVDPELPEIVELPPPSEDAPGLSAYERRRAREIRIALEAAERELANAEAARVSGRCAAFHEALVAVDSYTEHGFQDIDGGDIIDPIIPAEYSRDLVRRRAALAGLPCPPVIDILPSAPVVSIRRAPPLPPVREREPGWNADLYQRYSERVAELAELRDAGECEGNRGYLAGLQNLRIDLESSFATMRRAGPGLFQIERPVIEYFQSWLEAATAFGCSQPAPTVTPRPPSLHPIAGTYYTDRGDMRLDETGGTYGNFNGRITILRIDGDNVEGTWAQDNTRPCPNGPFGGRFRFRFDTAGFAGTYGECDEAPTARPWVGARDPKAAPPPPPPVAAAVPVPATLPPPVSAPAPDPGAPVNLAGFRPLPPVRPAEPTWNAALYRELSERVARIGALREQGKCDDYNYSMEGLKRDFAEEMEYASTLGRDEARARQAVVDYFEEEWTPQALRLGCTPPAPAPVAASRVSEPGPVAAPPPAAPARALFPSQRPGFIFLPDVRPLQPGWDRALYERFRDQVEAMGRMREFGECANYDRARAGFAATIASAQQSSRTQLDIDGDNRAYYSRQDVISYFRYWIDNLRELGCKP